MKRPAPHTFRSGVTLVGGAAYDAHDFEIARRFAPTVIAVDSGADSLVNTPNLIIGDLDSRVSHLDAPVLHLEEQDTTDFEKALYSTQAPLYVGVGFLADRFDHSLAACQVLIKYTEKPLFLLGETDVIFSLGTEFECSLPPNTRFSIFPLTHVQCTYSRGLEWSTEGIELSCDTQISISNCTTAEAVILRFDRPGALGILHKSFLPQLVAPYL